MKTREDNFREYLRKCCEARNIFPEESIQHKLAGGYGRITRNKAMPIIDMLRVLL